MPFLIFCLSLLFCHSLFSQDERALRELFSRESLEESSQDLNPLPPSLSSSASSFSTFSTLPSLNKGQNEILRKENPREGVHFLFAGPLYQIDLDEDKVNEKLLFEYRDGKGYFTIYSAKFEKLYTTSFQVNAINAALYKVTLVKLSPEISLVLLYYYEGLTQYIEREARSRLYFLTFKNKDIKRAKTFLGPYIWYEKDEAVGLNHLERFYRVNIDDYTGDGIKDVALKHGEVLRVFTYGKSEIWKEL